MKDLTSKQKAVLLFIKDYWETNSISPSFREIQEYFGFKSPNAVTKHLSALEQKGTIAMNKMNGFTKARSILPLTGSSSDVPLVGRIVAGMPVESVESIEGNLSLSSLGIDNSGGDYFALTVVGESMVNAHILDGDIVVIRKQLQVFENEVAAVFVDGEATLKYVKKSGNEIVLVPANDFMGPIFLSQEQVESFRVLGKVVTVIRSFSEPIV